MSRFFEVLKQASESLHLPPLGLDDSPIAPTHVGANQTDPLDSIVVADLPDKEPAAVAADFLLREEERPVNGSIGVSIETALDKKARLLPNLVNPMILESYRSARTKILQARSEEMFRVLLVTSAGPKEGKTVTVLNLALTFAMISSFKVLVMDGDFRRGSLTQLLGIEGRPGLSNVIDGSATFKEVIFQSSEVPFYFVGRGFSKLSPPELLHSNVWPTHMRSIKQHFDLILVDSPPVGLLTDSQLLAAGCDAVLFVARAFMTSRKQMAAACEELARFRVIGTILNGSATRLDSYRRYRSYYPETK